jgi:hypothetical protein
MPPPKPDKKKHFLSLSSRHHRLVVDSGSRQKVLDAGISLEDGKVLIVDCVDINTGEIAGISKLYQFQATSTTDINNHTIQFRSAPCWCAECVDNNYADCHQSLETGPWNSLNLDLLPVITKKKSQPDAVYDLYDKGGKVKSTIIVPVYEETGNAAQKTVTFYLMCQKPAKADDNICDQTTHNKPIFEGDKYVNGKRLNVMNPNRGPDEALKLTLDTTNNTTFKIPIRSIIIANPVPSTATREHWVPSVETQEPILGRINRSIIVYNVSVETYEGLNNLVFVNNM